MFQVKLILTLFSITSITGFEHTFCDSGDDFEICGYSDTITAITPLTNGSNLVLEVNRFVNIDEMAFHTVKVVDRLELSHPKPDLCTPKFVNISALEKMKVRGSVTLQCIQIPPNLDVFSTFAKVEELSVENVKFNGYSKLFYRNFGNLKIFTLSHHDDAIILPKIFDGVHRSLNELRIYYKIRDIEPRAFERFEYLQCLIIAMTELTRLKADMFEGLNELEYLSLASNKITALRSNDFIKLVELKELQLSNNRISEIENGTFTGLKLRILNLENNRLKNLPTDGFQNLESLETVNLGLNRIRTIPLNIFRMCFNLQWLNLDNNKIKNIEPFTFWGLHLNGLDLTHNKLRVLENYTFIGLEVRELMDLRFNNINKIQPQAFTGFIAESKVTLCRNNMTETNGKEWGAKNIHINISDSCSLPVNQVNITENIEELK
ncbi:leucine-rich repeat-containing protein 15-like [Fopius arisanus]|uniref:Leucine-rich repeat-containing protein 15-like n=1 Tax=Fopius arisanus TaxID=64838 RepID=A0A9R1T128_9HYME|nr:PREDICTED: leucine-rich repeat-containing protein 15-like [Fopius arisanus]